MKRKNVIALALAFGLVLAVGESCAQAARQRELSRKLLRLHVVANSDSEADQAVKLKVRDAVLACGVCRTPDEAELGRIGKAAEKCLKENGFDDKVRVTYENMYFDTRRYEGFSLPAGRYDAVRVVIGGGEGRNWWCVVYPALCTCLAEAEETGELSEDELLYIKENGTRYVVRFKLQELISRFGEELFGK